MWWRGAGGGYKGLGVVPEHLVVVCVDFDIETRRVLSTLWKNT